MRKEYTIVDHMVEMGYMDPELAWERHVERSMEEFYYFRSLKIKERRWWGLFLYNLYLVGLISACIWAIKTVFS